MDIGPDHLLVQGDIGVVACMLRVSVRICAVVGAVLGLDEDFLKCRCRELSVQILQEGNITKRHHRFKSR